MTIPAGWRWATGVEIGELKRGVYEHGIDYDSNTDGQIIVPKNFKVPEREPEPVEKVVATFTINDYKIADLDATHRAAELESTPDSVTIAEAIVGKRAELNALGVELNGGPGVFSGYADGGTITITPQNITSSSTADNEGKLKTLAVVVDPAKVAAVRDSIQSLRDRAERLETEGPDGQRAARTWHLVAIGMRMALQELGL